MAKKKSRMTEKRIQATEDLPPLIPNVIPSPDDDSEDDLADDGLNIRRRAFVEAITGVALGNATKAARIAGYASDNIFSLRVTACQLLTYPNVQAAIARTLARKRLDPDSVREDVSTLARSSMANFGKVVDGQFVLDWEAAAAAGAIGEMREVEMIEGENGKQVVRKFKIYDRTRAAELLAKMNGQLTEKHEVKVSGTLDHEHRVQNAMSKILSDPKAFQTAKDLAARISDKPENGNGNGNHH